MSTFRKKQISRSIRLFRDLSDDLVSADGRYFEDRLRIFMQHCENDVVMKPLTLQLKANRNVIQEEVFNQIARCRGSFVGSAKLKIPDDEEDRLATIYTVLCLMNEGRIGFSTLCVNLFGAHKFSDMQSAFSEQLFDGFIRDLMYRFEDLEDHLEEDSSFGYEELMIFQHFDKPIFLSNISNSNISVISGSDGDHNVLVGNESIQTIDDSNSSLLREYEEILTKICAGLENKSSIEPEMIEHVSRLESKVGVFMAEFDNARSDLTRMIEDIWLSHVAEEMKPKYIKAFKSQLPPIIQALALKAIGL